MKRIILAALAALVVAFPASAGPSLPLGTSWQGGGQNSPWVEQQGLTTPGVPTNPFGGACLWSVNDHEEWTSWGYLDPGASASRTKCVVSDGASTAPYGMSTVKVVSKSPELTVTVCFSQGRCFTPSPVYDRANRSYLWTFCGKVHYHHEDPALVEIPDSQGGYGVVSSVVTTISSTASKRVRDIVASVSYASDIGLFMGWIEAAGRCLPELPYVDHLEYPYQWTTS